MKKRGPRPKFKVGEKVYYLKSRMLSETSLEVGHVYFYNPAIEQSYLVTEGRPIYNITNINGAQGDIVCATHVAAFTEAGQRYLLDVGCWLYIQKVASTLRAAALGFVSVAQRLIDPRVVGGLAATAKYRHVMHTVKEAEDGQKKVFENLSQEVVDATKARIHEARGRSQTKNGDTPPGSRARRPRRNAGRNRTARG